MRGNILAAGSASYSTRKVLLRKICSEFCTCFVIFSHTLLGRRARIPSTFLITGARGIVCLPAKLAPALPMWPYIRWPYTRCDHISDKSTKRDRGRGQATDIFMAWLCDVYHAAVDREMVGTRVQLAVKLPSCQRKYLRNTQGWSDHMSDWPYNRLTINPKFI